MADKVTKNEIVDSIFENTNCDRKDILFVVDSFLAEVKKSLENGSTIELRGFGTFEPRLRKGKSEARNPKTGEKIAIPPHYVAAFKAGRELKENLWNLEIKDDKK